MDVVDIRSGYTFRAAIDSYASGDTEVIQAKDLNFTFDLAAHPTVMFPGEAKHLLKPGDILVSARGFSKAKLFKDKGVRAVASSSLFVLHPKNELISAEFIAMFFNSGPGMKAVLSLSSGASVQSITKENLGQIAIPEIPPDKERILGKVIQSIDDELALIELKQIHLNNIRETIITKTFKETTA